MLDDDGREIRSADPDPDAAPDAGDDPLDTAPAHGAVAEHDPLQDEWCSLTIDDDGMYRLSAGLHPENGDVVQNALDAARDRPFNDGGAEVDLVDALRLVAEQSLDSEPDQRRRARYATSVNIDVTGGGMIDTTGWRVPDSLRRYITCDGMLSPTFIDEGKPVSVGRSQYVIPQRSRTVIKHRDRGRCRVPGCTARYGLEVHHIIHWEDDGPTDTWNLVLICGKHHRMHHRGRLGIEGNADEPDGVEFRNAHGRIITPSGASPNPCNRSAAETGRALPTSGWRSSRQTIRLLPAPGSTHRRTPDNSNIGCRVSPPTRPTLDELTKRASIGPAHDEYGFASMLFELRWPTQGPLLCTPNS